MRYIDLAGMRLAILGGPDGQGGGTGPLVVLMHGYGASGDDLVPLAAELELGTGVRFAFPEAHLELSLDGVPLVPGFPAPRAWWPIDMARLQVGVATRSYESLRDEYPPGLSDARKRISAVLDGLQDALCVGPGNIVLGGFSQGAILACDVALHDPRPFKALLLMSGTLVGEATWSPLFEKRRGTKALQSHGQLDPVLPYELALLLHERTVAAGWKSEFVSFSGGHGLNPNVIGRIREFLREVLEK